MDSEADSSFSVPTRSTSKAANNPVWAHSRRPCDNDPERDPKLRYCTLCPCLGHPAPYYTSISTNMRRHLRRHHEITVESSVGSVQGATLEQLEQLERLYLNAKSSGQTEEIDAQVFEKQLNQNAINEALVSLIAVRNLPFRMVEWPEFHTFCQVLNPKSGHFITTAHSQIGRKIR